MKRREFNLKLGAGALSSVFLGSTIASEKDGVFPEEIDLEKGLGGDVSKGWIIL